MNISDRKYKEIEELISSDESVVGIDAKKTHILIIHMLREIQGQMSDLEKRLEQVEKKLDF
jgi:recombinational DNA repair protein RecR